MTYQEYRKLSADLRSPYDNAMRLYEKEQSELNKARVFKEFERYDTAQSRLFETYCRVHTGPF